MPIPPSFPRSSSFETSTTRVSPAFVISNEIVPPGSFLALKFATAVKSDQVVRIVPAKYVVATTSVMVVFPEPPIQSTGYQRANIPTPSRQTTAPPAAAVRSPREARGSATIVPRRTAGNPSPPRTPASSRERYSPRPKREPIPVDATTRPAVTRTAPTPNSVTPAYSRRRPAPLFPL
jgi:hypothetical protein